VAGGKLQKPRSRKKKKTTRTTPHNLHRVGGGHTSTEELEMSFYLVRSKTGKEISNSAANYYNNNNNNNNSAGQLVQQR
jgi:hypothetical protein